MTTAFTPMSFVPAPRPADVEPEPEQAPPAPVLVAVSNNTPTAPAVEETVLLPRHIAEAAYNVVQAIHTLKDDGALELFRKLGGALDKKARAHALSTPPCDACHIDVSQGLAHHPECWSDEAVRYRSLPLPQLDPFD